MIEELLHKIENQHDLTLLPDWGPYTKKYIGTSHLADKKRGIRFDLSVFPAYYRRRVDVPNVFFETEYYPWDASANLDYFSFRHMLEWKDRVYADISYHLYKDIGQIIRIDLVNNTKLTQALALHLMASIHFPSIMEYQPDNILYPAEVNLPYKGVWIDSLDYTDLIYAKSKPTDNLVADGKFRGEKRLQNFVNGSGIELGFDSNDRIIFDALIKGDFVSPTLLLRYASGHKQALILKVDENIIDNIELHPSTEPSAVFHKLPSLSHGTHKIEFTCAEKGIINMDGFAICENDDANKVIFKQIKWQNEPEEIIRNSDDSLIIKYKDSPNYYAIKWLFSDFQIREFFCKDLDSFFKLMANEHVKLKMYGEGKGHYTNIFLRPIKVKENSSKEIYAAVITSENIDALKKELNQIDISSVGNFTKRPKNHEISNKAGHKYLLSQNLMKAVLMSNIVFPVYTQKSFIRHSTPGKWWDCLYTWDSGFIGLGLLEYDLDRAIENLNVYLTAPGSQSAFIHHGSPVPVQHYLFFEIWNRTQSKELLEFFYPRLKQYYEFLCGKVDSSTTSKFKSGLLQTWDYFYNSGGWDDYPPQKYLHDSQLAAFYTPVITTAHCIRLAKFLRMYSDLLNLPEDSKAYDSDINRLRDSLQKHSWDEASGYFSYVEHDLDGNPKGILKYSENENFDKGLDGAYPLVSGICTDEQKEIMIERLKSPKHIWSDVGLSAVDQSASYYRKDGYWNGTTWMSHQWFYWKTMLDLGEYKFAEKIAMTALNLWKQETDSSYRCLEHFIIDSGRGAGWHAFGGLSAPVVSWFAAYYKPGTINTGFDSIILSRKFDKNYSKLDLKLKFFSRNKSSVLIIMNDKFAYVLVDKSKKCKLINRNDGQVIINFGTKNNEIIDIKIQKKD